MVIPAILSGGTGTRLWPVSRKSKPIQFFKLSSSETLFLKTVRRCRSELFDHKPIILGANDLRFLIAEDLQEVGVHADIILEPVARNSCPAIAVGCLHALKRTSNAIILVLAADYRIEDVPGFLRSVSEGLEAARDGYLVTFGVTPSHPSTGYGYIKPGAPLENGSAKVDAFVEKPSEFLAQRYIDEGYLWNSGNFLFRVDTYLAELETLAPEILAASTGAYERAETDLDFLRLDKTAFEASPSVSVDHAVMERTSQAAVTAAQNDRSDVGSWDAVWEFLQQGGERNAVLGDVHIHSGANNLVHSEGRLTTLVDVENTIVVSTRDCVLVASKGKSENVKRLVDELEKLGREEAVESPQIFRPWGNYEQLDIGDLYQVKRIVVKPGGVLSLQKHKRRAEHWIIVSGKAEITIGEKVEIYESNQSVHVPAGEVHRLANRGSDPVVLIEVQTGDYFGEDDVIRLDDEYNRSSGIQAAQDENQ